MKKIVDVKFVKENENLSGKDGIVRARPSGSGSGEGSGSGDNTGSFGSGTGMLSSSVGGSWSASCSFSWNARTGVERYGDSFILASVQIYVQNVAIGCFGNSEGTKYGGYFYEPFLCNLLIPSVSFSDSATSSDGITAIEFSAQLTHQVFKVTKTLYDSEGNSEHSEIKEEYKNVVVKFDFAFDNSSQKIEFVSCDISEIA